MKFREWCKRHYPLLLILAVLVIDQGSKFYIKLNMRIGEEIRIFDWFRIHFLENKGMAFGMSFGGDWGKLALSLIRIVAIVLLAWALHKVNDMRLKTLGQGLKLKQGRFKVLEDAGISLNTSLLVAMSLILAGAAGNLIDSAFYGLIFSESYFQVAQLFPEAGGYAGFLHGHVVDMLYFPLIEGTYPEWMPWVGGNPFLFFRPVFNVADSAITVGFFLFVFTQSGAFLRGKKKQKKQAKA